MQFKESGAIIFVLCALIWGGCASSRPYEEVAGGRGLHLFNRPAKGDAAEQWAHVEALRGAGRGGAAARQAYALRIFWPESEEAAGAQLLYARWLEGEGRWEEAAEQYQYLMEHYPGRYNFDEMVAIQMRLAKGVMGRRLGAWWIFPGVRAPERAIPLLMKVTEAAPESEEAAEAWLWMGRVYEETFREEEALNAYMTSYNRFPGSGVAEEALRARTLCQVKLADRTPNDSRSLDAARAACLFYLGRYPGSTASEGIREALVGIRERQAEGAYERAVYYDRVMGKRVAAEIEYGAFLERHSGSRHTGEAEARLAELKGMEGDRREEKE